MFQPDSRYYALDTATLVSPEGREITYVRRRFLPQGRGLPTLAEVTVSAGDRLDLIAARTIGSPEQFWRVCDAQDAMRPDELTEEPGRVLRIPIPQVDS